MKCYQAAIDIESDLESLEVLRTECTKNREFRVLGYRPVNGSEKPHLVVGHHDKDYLENFLRRFHRKQPQENVSDMVSLIHRREGKIFR